MRELIVGDVHFGIKSNSAEWLEKQCRLIDDQILETAIEKKVNRIVFLGDLSDIRYSINQQVGIELKNSVRKLADAMKSINAYIVFIAGNHDYYSPLEEASRYNAYETIFGKEFLRSYTNVHFVTETPLHIDDSLFLPWYWTENMDHFDDILYRYDFGNDVKAVYCHADLTVWPGPRIAALKGIPVYSGHIHYIVEDSICNLHNVGAACALTFADTNESRYLYLADDFKIIDKIPNVTTPKFIKLTDDEIFNTTDDMFENSYVQIWVSKKNISSATYIDQIKMLKSKYVDSNIRVHLIDLFEDSETYDGQLADLSKNISEYINENIPENLKAKYDSIIEKHKI